MFSLEPIGEDDFAFRYAVYEAAIKPYIDTFFDWDETQHQEKIRSNLAGSGVHCAVVVDGVRVGVVQIEETDDLISLHQIEILPEHQGAGIGTAIIRTLQERAAEAGKPVRLSVFLINTQARRLYERLGFAMVSTSDRDVEMRYTPPGGVHDCQSA